MVKVTNPPERVGRYDAETPPRVIVVIPTYNEAENLPELLRQIMSQGVEGLEVLLVDDNSPDGTADLAEKLIDELGGKVRVLRRPGKLGLGTAYLEGFAEALVSGADHVIEMDADLSHSPRYIPELLDKMRDFDVAIGSRWTLGGGVDSGWSLARRFLSLGASLYCRIILGLEVKDTTTGFKCFRRQALKGLDLVRVNSHGFAFQVEVAYLCQRKGYRITEVPILFQRRGHGVSKMSIGIILEALWRVLAIRLRTDLFKGKHL